MRDWLPRFAFDRPVTVLVGFVALLVLGLLAYARIPIQMMPEGFEPRFLWVRVPFPNATPAETDDLVVRPIEEQLSTISGLTKIDSRASSSFASFELEFAPSIPMSDAYADVVDRIERALPDLPADVERYWVFKFNPSDQPILWTGLTFPDDVEDPAGLLERVIQPRIERIQGVASIESWGVDERRLFIDYDREKMIARAVDIGDVQRKLNTDNFQSSGGRIEQDGEVRLVRSLARLTEPDELRQYPLRSDGLVLGDIAEISLRGVRSTDINRVEGRRAVALGVRKDSGANTVEVCEELNALLAELEADPKAKGVKFYTFFDQGKLIADSMNTLQSSALQGGLLSVLVLLVFLRELRMTLLISLAIPFSLLVTVAVMYLRGDTMNLVAMMGLMLAVGMVVDNAIVVVESIYARRVTSGSMREAAIEGTGEVGLAILASTATSMVVFLPVILMTEDADAAFFLGVLGLPVVWALGASLLVALVFAPLATRFVGGAGIKPDPAWLNAIQRHYSRLLRWTLARRADAGVGLLAATMLTAMVAIPGVKCVPGDGGGLNDFAIRFTVPRDANPDEREVVATAFETYVEAHREEWGVRVFRVQLNGSGTRGRAYIYLADDAPMSRDEVIEAARASLPRDLPGVTASVGWEGEGADDRRMMLSVYGEDIEVLTGLGEEMARRARAIPGVLDASVELEEEGRDEIRLRPDREALERYGVSASTVGNTVAFAMRGSLIEPLIKGEDELKVETRVALEDRSEIASLLDFPIFSPSTLSLVPVRALTGQDFGRGPGSIERTDRRTSVHVAVDLDASIEKGDLAPEIQLALSDMSLPRGYSWDEGDWSEDAAAESGATMFALAMSVVFVFLLMGVLFESWVLPLAVLVTIPMAMAGSFWGLYLTGTNLDTMGGIGLVVLVGVVVNNGIVLVDLITQLRAEGTERDVAVMEACRRRLRPILMTAVTTIVGLIPMALGSSDFVGIPYAPLGRTVAGGLAAATALTLLFVPWTYVLLDDARTWAGRTLAWARRTPA